MTDSARNRAGQPIRACERPCLAQEQDHARQDRHQRQHDAAEHGRLPTSTAILPRCTAAAVERLRPRCVRLDCAPRPPGSSRPNRLSSARNLISSLKGVSVSRRAPPSLLARRSLAVAEPSWTNSWGTHACAEDARKKSSPLVVVPPPEPSTSGQAWFQALCVSQASDGAARGNGSTKPAAPVRAELATTELTPRGRPATLDPRCHGLGPSNGGPTSSRARIMGYAPSTSLRTLLFDAQEWEPEHPRGKKPPRAPGYGELPGVARMRVRPVFPDSSLPPLPRARQSRATGAWDT